MTLLTRALVTSLITLTLAPAPVLAQTGVTGDWEIAVNTPQGESTVNLTLKQEGEKVTGNLSSPMGSMPITGTFSGGALTLGATLTLAGNSLELGLNGKLEGETMNGTVKFGDFGEFPFLGKRGAPKTAAASPATPTAPATALPAIDANGTWNIVLTIQGVGEFPVSGTFKQEGDKVTGVLSSVAGEVPVSGTMTGRSLKLEFTAQTPQGELPITMTGELGEKGFTGKASVAGIGEADWTATRVQ